MAFESLPVVHLERGRFPEYPSVEPEAALTELARRFGRVVLVDVEGVRSNDADLEFIQAASRRRSLWVDAGSRYATDAMDLFVAGAESVTMRWNTLHSSDELAEAAEMCQPGTLWLGLEFPQGRFLSHGRDKRDAAAVAEWADGLGVGLVLILERPTESLLRSLPPSRSHRFVQGVPRGLVGAAESMGYQGALLAPSEIPEESP